MEYHNSDSIYYKNNELYCEELAVSEIIEETGTPAYIYSKQYITSRYQEFSSAFNDVDHTIFYAVKSNFNLNILKIFKDLGSSFDVNSGGELYRVMKAGVPAERIILTGVGKTETEIRLGIENNLLMIKAESEEEIYLIDKIAKEMNKIVPVAIRVNPDVDAQTHPYISTGLAENKFGVNTVSALNIFRRREEFKNIQFTGIDMHIGSQIVAMEPFIEAVEKLAQIFLQLKEEGLELKHFDVGGGIGVQYNNENVFSIKDYAEKVIPVFKKLNCKIMFEPGRYFTANGGILAGKIQYVKENNNKTFYVIDAAMNDLVRPSFYQAYHHIQPVVKGGGEDIVVDVVGPICETGDYLAKNRTMEKMKAGDLLAILSCGAYGMVMSSNYNARRRAPEILVDKNKYYVIRGRETYEHLLFDEEIIESI